MISLNNKIIAIIPARGGSKSIPKKNTKILGFKPLIAYPIELAKSIKEIDRIIVSTDNKSIAEIAKEYGAEVPFLRPKELAQDNIPTLPVLQHTIKFLEENENYKADIIILLYPTCPFLKKKSVIQGINKLKNENINSIISVSEDYGRYWIYNKNKNQYIVLYPEKRVNRQYYKPLYKENGAIYFSKYKTLMNDNKIVDDKKVDFIIMNENEIIDIDTPKDWIKAEQKFKNN